MKDLEQKKQKKQVQVIEQVPNTYYYEKLYDDKHLGSFTESTKLAHQLGWQDNHVLITDTEVSELNGWTYLKGYAPQKSLDAFKKERLNELADKASQYEKTENKDMYIISSLGFKVNADPKALRNIDVLISLQVNSFRSYDNTDYEVTVDDLQTIKQEISLNALNLYNQKWQMEREINDLTKVDDVNDYVISFYMMDFTNE